MGSSLSQLQSMSSLASLGTLWEMLLPVPLEILKGTYTQLQPFPDLVCKLYCQHRDPAGNTPFCVPRDPEITLY